MWNDFFYYSKSERRAVLCLLVLAVVAITLYMASEAGREPQPEHLTVSERAAIDSFLLQVEERKRPVRTYAYPSRRYDTIEVVLQPFDPNRADSLTFRRLGLPAFIARNILRYRAKGGVFRSPDAFARVYGITDEQFRTLRPYIVIDEGMRRDTFPQRDSLPPLHYPPSPPKLAEGTVLALNTADTTILKQVPGIAGGLAALIVAYRERLGGFTHVEQLQEVSPYADTSLNKWFEVGGEPYRKIEVNRYGIDRLRSHPYMNFYKAKAIIEFRRKRGPIKSLSQLAVFEEFSEHDLQRLLPYLSFE